VNQAEQARIARIWTLTMIYHAGSGHPGGSLSAADLLIQLVGLQMAGGASFILSKGHAAPALYAALALHGALPLRELAGFRRYGSRLQGHPSLLDLPEVGASTGSLGQGFSVAIGRALGARHLARSRRFFALLGDGEMQEGQVWEAALFAAHQRLHTVTAILDWNGLQSDDYNHNILNLDPLAEKWHSFGWAVETIDGHDHQQIAAALAGCGHKPRILLARTLKGKGVPFMENQPAWHGSVKLKEEELVAALTALGLTRTHAECHLDPSCFEKMEMPS
jgi:transketolase